MINYNRLLENKILIFIDKLFRLIGKCIVLHCNTDTEKCYGFHIDNCTKFDVK